MLPVIGQISHDIEGFLDLLSQNLMTVTHVFENSMCVCNWSPRVYQAIGHLLKNEKGEKNLMRRPESVYPN